MSYLVNSSFGPEDLERATVPFILACAAANKGDARVFLTCDALNLVVKGRAEGLTAPGYTPVLDLINEFTGKGGHIWVCRVCAAVMGIEDSDLVEGATIGGAPDTMEFLAGGGKTLV